MPLPPRTPPPAEFTIDSTLVRRLLDEQHPDMANLELALVAEGWDNVMFRLGADLMVRLPRRSVAAGLVVHEQAWLPRLAPLLSITIPAPVRCGRPTTGFPWHWSVLPWVPGTNALEAPLLASEAGRMGSFLHELHAIPVPNDPPHNPFRGGQLADRRTVDEERLQRLAASGSAQPILARLTELISAGTAAPLDEPPTWLHGDLHPKNVVSQSGRVASIIDWGDICTGDRATDLAAVWRLFPDSAHPDFWEAYGVTSTATRHRSAAWAVVHGLMIWDSHHEADPTFAAAALETLRRASRG